MDLVNEIKNRAKKETKRIILPESFDERTLKATDIILQKKIADIILIGKKQDILKKASSLKLKNTEKARIIDPVSCEKLEVYANLIYEIRKDKGLTKDQAFALLQDPLYFAAIMIKNGDADGEVAGAENSTGNVLRPALQLIKTMPGISVVSGIFIMILQNKSYGENGIMLFADCAVNPTPDFKQLAEIAISSAKTAKSITGIEPRIAMLSFSTKGSAEHTDVEKVKQATQLVKEIAPTIQIDGELQADAALVASVAQKKAPQSIIAGKANTLIFPDLNSGNIGYKLVQRLAGAEAIGPVLQGMAAPVNDLSRGCSVDDIVNLVAITANQAINL